jgi:16S rRNA processing protein RimM
MQKYLECGIITNTHGINGGVKVLSQCDTPEDLASLEYVYIEQLGVYRELEVTSASVYKDTVIFTFDGIDSIDKASRLKGKTLYADRDDFGLEEGEYFLADVIGCKVIDENSGKVYGVIEGVNTNSAQLLYEVKTEGGIRLLPAVDAFISRVEIPEAVYVTPVPGLLDDLD